MENKIMYGYVYMTTNLVDGKKYIGQHKSTKFNPNYKGSGKYLKFAVDKYGAENFKVELLEWCETKEKLDQQEAYYIEFYDAVNSKDFYNLVPGGFGNNRSGVRYMNNGVEYRRVPIEEIDDYLAKGFVFGGRKPSREVVERRANSNRGQKRTLQTCKNISIGTTGKKRDQAYKDLVSARFLGKPAKVGGTIYVHNPETKVTKRIKPELLEEYLAQGFIPGRESWGKDKPRKNKNS